MKRLLLICMVFSVTKMTQANLLQALELASLLSKISDPLPEFPPGQFAEVLVASAQLGERKVATVTVPLLTGLNLKFDVLNTSTARAVQQVKINPQTLQIPVLRQNGFTPAPSGEGLNCGYHALKNSILLVNALAQTNANYLQQMQSVHLYVNWLKDWRDFIKPYRKLQEPVAARRYSDGSMASGTELERIIRPHFWKQEFNKAWWNKDVTLIPDEYTRAFGGDLTEVIHVVDDPDVLQNVRGMNASDLAMFHTIVSGQDCVYAIIVNTTKGGSHWISYVIAQHNGQRIIYFTDSMGGRGVLDRLLGLMNKTVVEYDAMLNFARKTMSYDFERAQIKVNEIKGFLDSIVSREEMFLKQEELLALTERIVDCLEFYARDYDHAIWDQGHVMQVIVTLNYLCEVLSLFKALISQLAVEQVNIGTAKEAHKVTVSKVFVLLLEKISTFGGGDSEVLSSLVTYLSDLGYLE